MQITPEKITAIAASIEKVQGEVAAFDKIAAGIAAIEKMHPSNLAIDVTNAAGMRQAIAGRAAWRDPRIAVEKARKAAKAPVLDLGRQIDAFASGLELALREGESNYDDQIKAEESRKETERAAKAEAEAARVQAHQARIVAIRSTVLGCNGKAASEIEFAAALLNGRIIGADLEEFQVQAQLAKDETLDKLREMHAAAVAHEAEQARIKAEQEAEAARIAAERSELARLRAESEAREREAAAARAEQERKDREARAAAEREQAAALAAERAAQAEELRKQREAQDAELKAQREAQARADAEAAAVHRAEEARLAAERQEIERQRAEQEAERQAEIARKQRAFDLVTQAAQSMAEALTQWRDAEKAKDEDKMVAARIARDAALSEAGL